MILGRDKLARLWALAAAAYAALLAAGCATTAPDPALVELQERAAIDQLIKRADRGLDVADVEMFVSSFTEDAVLQNNEATYTGREEIRALVQGRADARDARLRGEGGDPNTQLYRVTTNSIVEFTGADTAHHTAYVVVVGHTTPETHLSASGTYDDQLVKRDGRWLIQTRRTDTLPRFVPPPAEPAAQ